MIRDFISGKKQISYVYNYLQNKIKEESGFTLKGFVLFILFVAFAAFLTIHLIRPSYCSGRFKTAINSIATDGFAKSNKEIREEIVDQAEEIGVVLDDEDILINGGLGSETLEIKLDYSFPVDLYLYQYNRQFSYTLTKKLSYPKKMIDRTEQKLKGSYNKMVEKARNAEQKFNYDE
ncbi:MAG: hypothetical protein ACMUIU_17640 [bacterium]